MLGAAGGVSGSGGVEPPKFPEVSGVSGGNEKDSAKPGRSMLNLKNYFISKMGKEKGEKMYNQFVMTTFVMPAIQQMQKDQQKMKEIQDQMMG